VQSSTTAPEKLSFVLQESGGTRGSSGTPSRTSGSSRLAESSAEWFRHLEFWLEGGIWSEQVVLMPHYAIELRGEYRGARAGKRPW
jgi:hypothetical protein